MKDPAASSPFSAAGQYSFTSCISFLNRDDSGSTEINVPTSAPALDHDEDDRERLLDQDEHATSTSTLFMPSSTATKGFILSRLIDQSTVLELSYTTLTTNEGATMTNELDALKTTQAWPPVRFGFNNDRIVNHPFLTFVPANTPDEHGELQVYVVTESAYLYVLHFPLPRLFYSASAFDGLDEDDDGGPETRDVHWIEEFKIHSLHKRVPALLHGVDVSRVVVACLDGFVTSLIIADADALIETELRSSNSTFFNVRSLLPFGSSSSAYPPSPSNVSTLASPTAASSQIISFASTLPQQHRLTFAFSVSRDRKLKVWNLDSGVLLKSTDLPRPSSSPTALITTNDVNDSSDTPSRPKPTSLLLPPTPQRFVKLIETVGSSSYSSYLVLFSPASSSSVAAFFIYGIATNEQTGALDELIPIAERICPPSTLSNSSLVDFEVSSLGQGDQSFWTLWSLWDHGGEAVIRTTALPEIEGDLMVETGDAEETEVNEWVVVDSGSAGLTTQWTSSHFDELLEANPMKNLADIFVEHVSYPNRYPFSTLDHALMQYELQLERELEQGRYASRPEALSLYYETVLERVVAVVGSVVQLEQSPQTGAFEYEQYNKRLKTEWLRFVAMLNESRRAALFPTSLAVDFERKVALALTREAVIAPVARDVSQALVSVVDSGAPMSNLGSYSPLCSRETRTDLATLVYCIKGVRSALTPISAQSLETALVNWLRSPLASSIQMAALDLYESFVEAFIDEDLVDRIDDALRSMHSIEEAVLTLNRLLVSSTSVVSNTKASTSKPASDLASSLITDCLASLLETRYDLSLGLSILLLFIHGEEDGLISSLEQLTSQVFTSFHSLSALRWIARQPRAPGIEAELKLAAALEGRNPDDDVLSRFGAMGVSSESSEDDIQPVPLPAYSLLNTLVRTGYTSTIALPSSALPLALSGSISSFLARSAILSSKHLIVDSASEALLAMKIYDLGLPLLANEFIHMYPKGAGLLHINGLSEVAVGRAEEAEIAFAKAANGLYTSRSAIPNKVDSTLSQILPGEAAECLTQYYSHVVAIFVDHGFDSSVVRFAELALDSLDDEPPADNVGALNAVAQDLWLHLFRSQAALGRYEDAYSTLMAVTDPSTRATCLAHLISVMCENGAVQDLVRFAFVGFEAELERNLAFRARNSDPLATPNYYKILYAYHIAKGDYRSAGTIMFQQARRIGETSSRKSSFRDLATAQCQSYLAAVNALALVPTEDAWLVIANSSTSSSDETDRTKRRRIVYDISEEELSVDASTSLELLHLSDVRQEYAIALARLQLSVDFLELERTTFGLDGDAVVALFTQTAAFDAAFQAARVLQVDMASLFEAVTDRCVGLASNPESMADAGWVTFSDEASTWEGTLASKAWRLLERHLNRHDDSTSRYRLVVLERTLAIDRKSELPAFLTEHFMKRNVSALLRALIKYERLGDAFKYSITTLWSLPIANHPASSFLPYSTFDQLLNITPNDTAALSPEALTNRQAELGSLIEKRFVQTEKAQRVTMKNMTRS